MVTFVSSDCAVLAISKTANQFLRESYRRQETEAIVTTFTRKLSCVTTVFPSV